MASSSSSFSLASTPVCNASASETNLISSSSPIDESLGVASNEGEVPNIPSSSCSLGNGKNKRKPTRPPAAVWAHFERVGLRAKCKYCGKDYASDPKKMELPI
ncbi:zinc finger BED domain-containing protein RICESLEEPER 2-like [Iris pallida]|uniref:Zinc finger BED domain-containing protein RICESLEEPER 2-like n=1 Tax=Iris pallida TaxID=29817 RepID=A0AAX6GP62_IRIPA|nr:zinc finger BED domain-containing protein RICESLEEPER 2-like [Iris pallida]